MIPKMEVQGLEKINKAITELVKTDTEKAKRIISRGALQIEGKAKQRCPVGTPESTHIKGYVGGRLRASIHTVFERDGLVAKIGTDVYYAPYVEFGTVKMRARPYLRSSAEEVIAHILEEWG